MFKGWKKLGGYVGKAYRHENVAENIGKGFAALGKPGFKTRPADFNYARRGKRRAAAMGGLLGVNAMMAPRRPKSSGGSGYIPPRSSGGYA